MRRKLATLTGCRLAPGILLLAAQFASGAEAAAPAPATPVLPDVGFSLVRVFGALVLVLALFLAGVWLFKNWQRLAVYKGRVPKLNILEVRPLGGRHALYLVAYEQQRFLISSSPAGINLLTHLPESDAQPAPAQPPMPNFTDALRQALTGKTA